jgi:hypothetical protein
VAAAAAANGGGQQSAARRYESSSADLVFSGGAPGDGSIVMEGRGGDLTFRKKVFQNGSFSIDVEVPRDSVSLNVVDRVVTIRRGRRTITLDLAASSEDDLDKARRLLADSRAVRLLRSAAAALQEAEDEGPGAMSLMASDAMIGMLTGDVGAPGRAARHFARRQRARLRPVGSSNDCYAEWEKRAVGASYEWEWCAMDFAPWNPIRHLCAARWILQVESYWFQLISCIGFPGV